MKTEVEIWTVLEGQLKEIKMENEIFVLQKKLEEVVEIPKVLKTTKKINPNTKRAMTIQHHKDLGIKYIGKENNMRIVDKAHEKLMNTTNTKERIAILKEFYPYTANETLMFYDNTYKRYAHSEKRKEANKQPPSKEHLFSKTYGTWVSPQEIREVRRCIGMTKDKYRPTVKAIAGETDMKEERIRAVLDSLIRKGEVYIRKKGVTPIYHFVSTQ